MDWYYYHCVIISDSIPVFPAKASQTAKNTKRQHKAQHSKQQSIQNKLGNRIQCVVVAKKNPQWRHHNVIIRMVDGQGQQTLQTFHLTAQQSKSEHQASVNQVKKTFNCFKHPKVQFRARFTPAIWSTNKGAVYTSANVWDISKQLQKVAKKQNRSKLVITVQFPKDFESVPALINS